MTSTEDAPENECMFCQDHQSPGLSLMMNEALMSKHASSQNDSLIGYIDVIMKLEEPCNASESWAAYQYRECQVIDEEDEFLKREYMSEEYGGKITMLAEYYKFHVDLPRVVQKSIEKILGKYYDKKREFDYKKIKRILKEEQGLSITSVQESESSLGDSAREKKSRYSIILDQLEDPKVPDEQMSDSKLLKEMCNVIEKALPRNQVPFDIKGSFHHLTHPRIFQEYLQRQQRKQSQKPPQPSRRVNLQDLLRKRGQKQLQRSKQKDSNVRDSRELKKKQKESKFVYNTNIKIQIKNAMFYSHGQNQQQQHPPFNIGNIEYDSGNKVESKFRKKNLINQMNILNLESNKKLVGEIYKSHQNDFKRKLQSNSNSKQRLTTKESINRSTSKSKKQTSRNSSNKELRKSLSGGNSARKLPFPQHEWTLTSKPSRSSSATALKKRSYSSNAPQPGFTLSTASLRKSDRILQKRPIETISRYGSSDVKRMDGAADRERRAISIKQLLNRKLSVKKE